MASTPINIRVLKPQFDANIPCFVRLFGDNEIREGVGGVGWRTTKDNSAWFFHARKDLLKSSSPAFEFDYISMAITSSGGRRRNDKRLRERSLRRHLLTNTYVCLPPNPGTCFWERSDGVNRRHTHADDRSVRVYGQKEARRPQVVFV